MSVNVLSTKVPFLLLLLETGRHFTWPFEPREGISVCSQGKVSTFISILSYLKTLSIGPTPGIETQPPALQPSSALPTELILPRLQVMYLSRPVTRGGARGAFAPPPPTRPQRSAF